MHRTEGPASCGPFLFARPCTTARANVLLVELWRPSEGPFSCAGQTIITLADTRGGSRRADMAGRNPRYYAVGGWKARNAAIAVCRARAAAGEPCAICGQPIDVARAWIVDDDGRRKRDPLSCECDEVVPVSRGGSPVDLENVRPVHRICNERRGAGRDVLRRSKASETLKRLMTHETGEGVAAGRW